METQPAGRLFQPADPASMLDKFCKICGNDFKAEKMDGSFYKCCNRCLDVWKRMLRYEDNTMIAEKIILKTVGREFYEAVLKKMDNLELARTLWRLKRTSRSVYLHGPVGVGKTHAIAALIRYFVYMGYECKLVNFNRFCLRYCDMPYGEKSKYLNEHILVDKLFIDDLGLRSEQESNFRYENLFDILNERLERNLPVYISSNKSPQQIGKVFDSRIESRLRPAFIYEMKGKDRRTAG